MVNFFLPLSLIMQSVSFSNKGWKRRGPKRRWSRISPIRKILMRTCDSVLLSHWSSTMSQNEESTFASDSEISKTSSPSSSDVEQFPKCTSDWDCHFVDKLCVSYKQEDIIRIISSEWSLFHLYEEDRLEVERCLNACDLKLNYESLEDLPPDVTTPIEKFARGWEPNQLQLRVMQAEPLLKKYLFYSIHHVYQFIAFRLN